MANSYIPRWQNISVNFNDANSMMDTAISGVSKAGTVFDKMRQGILDEEQRAIENARAAEAAALAQADLDERIRANRADEAHAAATLAEQIRATKEEEKYNNGMLGLRIREEQRILDDEKAADLAREDLPAFLAYAGKRTALTDALNTADNNLKTLKTLGQGRYDASRPQDATNWKTYDEALAEATQKQSDANLALSQFDANNPVPFKLSAKHLPLAASEAGRQTLMQEFYRQRGGRGYMQFSPLEVNMATQELANLTEQQKKDEEQKRLNAMSEQNFGKAAHLQEHYTKFGFADHEARNLTKLTMAVQKAAKTEGAKLSNIDVANYILASADKKAPATSWMGKLWEGFFGDPTLELNDAAVDSYVQDILKDLRIQPTGSGTNGGNNKNKLVPTKLPQNENSKARIAKEVVKHEQTTGKDATPEDVAAIEARLALSDYDEEAAYVAANYDVATILKNLTSAQKRSLGIHNKTKLSLADIENIRNTSEIGRRAVFEGSWAKRQNGGVDLIPSVRYWYNQLTK